MHKCIHWTLLGPLLKPGTSFQNLHAAFAHTCNKVALSGYWQLICFEIETLDGMDE